jgi:hypothetical protein
MTMNFDGFVPNSCAIIRSSPGPDENYIIREAFAQGKTEDEVVALLPDVEPGPVRKVYNWLLEQATTPEAQKEAEDAAAALAEESKAKAKEAKELVKKATSIAEKIKAREAAKPAEAPSADPLG